MKRTGTKIPEVSLDEIRGQPDHTMPLKQQLCVEALVAGHVNSFVDLFYLTHRSDEDASKVEQMSPEQLQAVKDNLTIAEVAHRRGDSEKVYEAYEHLASHFRGFSDYKTAIYFYEKCLDIADSLSDRRAIGDTQLQLGSTYEAMGDLQSSIRCYERHLTAATELGDEERIHRANQCLVEVYRRYAEELDRKDEPSDRKDGSETSRDFASASSSSSGPLPASVLTHKQTALTYYKKCQQAAHSCGDSRSEGAATYRLGVVCALLGDKKQAVEYQTKYLELCRELNDQQGEGAACASLASAFQDLGDTKLAIRYLERFLELATKNKEQIAQARACAALGAIYSSQGQHDKAVPNFERSFEIARALNDRKLLDAARINLGMARGNLSLAPFMDVVRDNLAALLKWKTRRVTFK